MARRAQPDITMGEVARLLGMKLPELRKLMPELCADGFPRPDKRTKRFDPEAVERWRRLRNPHLFPELSTRKLAKDAQGVDVGARLNAL